MWIAVGIGLKKRLVAVSPGAADVKVRTRREDLPLERAVGSHQLARPRSSKGAGTNTMRTMVASMNIA